MTFKDREGINLNRKRLTIISQTPTEIIADIERADTVTQEGTKINASVFNAFQASIDASTNNANNALSIANSASTTANSALATANTNNSNISNALSRIQTLENNMPTFTLPLVNAPVAACSLGLEIRVTVTIL